MSFPSHQLMLQDHGYCTWVVERLVYLSTPQLSHCGMARLSWMTVTHSSTNQARHRATTLSQIKENKVNQCLKK